ncbi:hypothetical protein [Ruminococcus sp.]|uniref:hypothetical protein n=1 Tax=Ruminococcus sp. TaxID=41978 RepID=UPI0025D71ED2|nr:hypothetical protein [Ruminococcus sp.]MBQ8967028.1 hypothetical protein [Ruminococcus sp.]
MKKNIIVTDANGNVIGSTYPKRAEGLVKNGRAEYVSDCEIRLVTAHAPTEEIKTEDDIMSKIISFDPRKFGFDKSCRLNAGQRAFMTTTLGNTEVWEIGDHDKHRTQIISKMKLQRYTDYTFRFAMTGGHNEDGTEVSQVNIYPENRWDDRLTFALEKSRFEPVISKRDKTGLLRVFELPFNTANAEDWSIIITQERAPARFFAPLDPTAYSMLENMSYQQWLNENSRRRGLFGKDSRDTGFRFEMPDLTIGGGAFKKLIDMGKQGFDVDKIIDKARQGFDIEKVIDQVKQGIDPDGSVFGSESKPDYVDNGEEDNFKTFTTGKNGQELDFADLDLDESGFADKLVQIGSACNVKLRGSVITPCDDRSFMMIGNTSTACNFEVQSVGMTAYALSMLLAKVGDGCTVKLKNVKVTDDGVEMMINTDSCSGAKLEMDDVTLPKQALDLIYSRFGRGCEISANNISTTFTPPKEEKAPEKSAEPAPEKDIPPKSESGGYFFKDMLRSTFENAAEGFNTFGEMMRKAEEDINDVIGGIVNDKPADKDSDEDKD